MLGADEGDALFFDPLGELRVLAQESVAGVHGLRARLLAGGNDFFGLQVAVSTRRRANVNRFIGQLDMARILVGIGINRDGFDAHLAGGLDDAAGDFTAVCDQYLVKHMLSPSG